MKPTELITSGVDKVNPMKVLTYDEAHEKVSKIHNKTIKKIVPGIVERAEKETEKLVKRK
jgi:hypothetical protein